MTENFLQLGKAQFINEKTCRLCFGVEMDRVLSLGMQPLANSLPESCEEIALFPLNLVRCRECGLVQIRETIYPQVLFGNYLYFSSYADTLIKNARSLVDSLFKNNYVKPGNLIIEVGSNDGYLLQFYKTRNVKVLGVEPATNVAEVAIKERGVPTRVAFFTKEIAKEILVEFGEAQIIHANNVLAHTASLHSIIEGISILLSQNGVLIAEVQYFKDMADMASFDMIYHEHLCYYVFSTFESLLNKHGLWVFHVEHISTHGGSLRVYASKGDIYHESNELCAIRDCEMRAGLSSDDYYLRYAKRIGASKEAILNLLNELRHKGKKTVAYGAAAKTTVMFNYLGIDSRLIRYVMDRSPHKQGRVIPGTDLIIHPVERMAEEPPDYIFLSAWNLAKEIMTQLDEYTKKGVRYIIPLPELMIL